MEKSTYTFTAGDTAYTIIINPAADLVTVYAKSPAQAGATKPAHYFSVREYIEELQKGYFNIGGRRI